MMSMNVSDVHSWQFQMVGVDLVSNFKKINYDFVYFQLYELNFELVLFKRELCEL